MHQTNAQDSSDVDMPDFSAAVMEEFGFRRKARGKYNYDGSGYGVDVEPSHVSAGPTEDDDYAPRSRVGTRKKRVYKPRKKRTEDVEPKSDDDAAPSTDSQAYFSNTAPRVDADGNDLFCICRKGDLGKWMIGCDGCDEWYHGDCVNVSKLDEDLIDQFFCPRCHKDGHGNTIWKRKCRLADCRQPAREIVIEGEDATMTSSVAPSHVSAWRYCSREHGVAYFQDRVEQALISKRQMKSLVMATTNVGEFQMLGNTAPKIDGIVSDIEEKRLQEMTTERERIHEGLRKLEARMSCLNDMQERAMRVNTALKARKEKDICGYDERLSIQDNDLDTLIQSNGFVDSLLGSTTDKLCTVLAKKCNRHAGWHGIKFDIYTLEGENLRDDLDRLRSEDQEIRLAAKRRLAA